MSRKTTSVLKHLGINKDLLFEKIGEAVSESAKVLDIVGSVLDEITPEHEIDVFDFDSLVEIYGLNKKRFTEVKNELRVIAAIQGDVYEELLYNVTKSVNCFTNRIFTMVTLYNAMVEHYSIPEVLPVRVELVSSSDDDVPVVVLPKRRGRPPASKKTVKAKPKVKTTPRITLEADTIDFEVDPIEVNVILNKATGPTSPNSSGNFDISCQQCEVKLIDVIEDDVPILKCPVCGFKELSFTENLDVPVIETVGAQTETKRKPGGGSGFIEAINAIQGKLEIKPKDKELVDDAIEAAKKYFRCGIDCFDTFRKWFRSKHAQTAINVSGIKKYSDIYKYEPIIYSAVTGIKLASITDQELEKIEAVYNIISIEFRETHFKMFAEKSNKSIQPGFYIERLIEIYVKDVRRQRLLKSVISTKTGVSDAVHDAVWTKIKGRMFGQ